MKEAEQNQSVEKVFENGTSESDDRCNHVVKSRPEQSPETVTTEASPEKANNAESQAEIVITAREVAASPEKANNAESEAEIIITPHEAQPRPCSKTSKWACFACCDFQKHL